MRPTNEQLEYDFEKRAIALFQLGNAINDLHKIKYEDTYFFITLCMVLPS